MIEFLLIVFASVGIYCTVKTFYRWCKTVKKEMGK